MAGPLSAGLRRDVEALAAMTRDSAGAGERAAAAWVAERMRAAGAAEVAVEPFRYQGTYAWAHVAHEAAGLLAAALPRRGPRAALALAVLASLELEASGRRQWMRRLLPAGEGANVVGRLVPEGPRQGTLVLVAHHDAARTGFVWRPGVQGLGARRHARRRRIDPFLAPPALGLLAVAAGFRRTGAALLAAAVAAAVDIARSPTVPGASDNATGVAAVLALLERFAGEDALPGVEVVALSTGCEESGMGGMAAWLRDHGAALDPRTTLVLGLDTLGAGTPIACAAEGAIVSHRYGGDELALTDAGAVAAGLEPPERWRIGGWTDPILARFAGLPALSLLSMGPGLIPHYHHPSDRAEHVDWACAERCVALAEATARVWADTLPAR